MSTPNELEEVTLALPDLALGILTAAEAERLAMQWPSRRLVSRVRRRGTRARCVTERAFGRSPGASVPGNPVADQ